MRRPTLAAALAATLLLALAARSNALPTLPPGFASLPIGGSFVNPTGICIFAPGKMLVCEKRGKVFYLENDFKKNEVIDVSLEALDNGDRGLLAVATDPDFAINGWMYLLIVVDPNLDGNDSEQFAFSRLVRYQTSFDASGNLVTNLGSRQVLLGATWSTAIPSCHLSHSIGNIKFLNDGSLVLTCGDGAHYDLTDAGGYDPGCFGPGQLSSNQDVGAFRSVMLDSYSGKVLRMDRNTGLGLPDNPYYTGNPNDIRSHVYAMGLRNPYRFAVLPGTGPKQKLMISDVGWNDWEELDLCKGGENFGWPCYEGVGPQNQYQAADPAGFTATVVHAPPLLTWNHGSAGSLGFKGNCATGVTMYVGSEYPPLYQNTLFFCDYGQSWIRYLRLDANDHIVSNQPFATKAGSPTAMEYDPATGELVLASLENGGTLQRIRYVGNTTPPVAKATATPAYGAAPLTVQFKGSDSSSPTGGALTYAWDFGDNTTSNVADPLKLYGNTGSYVAKLTVTNVNGFTATANVLVTPGNTPPQIVHVRSPEYGLKYKVGKVVALEATTFDKEDRALQLPLDMSWHVDLIHKEHVHPDFAVINGPIGSFQTVPHGDAAYFLCRFVVKDSFGLVTEQDVPIYDADTVPAADLEDVSDAAPRLGQPVSITLKMYAPGVAAPDPLPTLGVNWGDGTGNIAISAVADQSEKTLTHTYAAAGKYTVKFTASLGSKTSSDTTQIDVKTPKPAIAIFTPLLAQKYIPWNSQQSIAQTITSTASAYAGGTEVKTFSAVEQSALVAWMTKYMNDGVKDVIVMMDYAPSKVFAGEFDDSLAEQWIEHGNGIVWTGFQPFFSYVDESGFVSSYFASAYGADFVLDAPLFALVSSGSGAQVVKPIAATEIPTLVNYTPTRALKYLQVGSHWTLDRLYADSANHNSDAVVIKDTSGGFFAEFYVVDADMPRAAVIDEFLKAYVTGP